MDAEESTELLGNDEATTETPATKHRHSLENHRDEFRRMFQESEERNKGVFKNAYLSSESASKSAGEGAKAEACGDMQELNVNSLIGKMIDASAIKPRIFQAKEQLLPSSLSS